MKMGAVLILLKHLKPVSTVIVSSTYTHSLMKLQQCYAYIMYVSVLKQVALTSDHLFSCVYLPESCRNSSNIARYKKNQSFLFLLLVSEYRGVKMATGAEPLHEVPLYFFYASKTTGSDIHQDRIIQIAAVVHVAAIKSFWADNTGIFSSYCYHEEQLSQDVLQRAGTTMDVLRKAKTVQEVLEKFFGWIKNIKYLAENHLKRNTTPVLVAHGGKELDFPMLLKEINSSQKGLEQIKSLDFHYVDTRAEFEARRVNEPFYRHWLGDLPDLELDTISLKMFKEHIEKGACHRAKALAKITVRGIPHGVDNFYRYSKEDFILDSMEELL